VVSQNGRSIPTPPTPPRMTVILNGIEQTITKEQLHDLAARGIIRPDTVITINGKSGKAGQLKGVIFGSEDNNKIELTKPTEVNNPKKTSNFYSRLKTITIISVGVIWSCVVLGFIGAIVLDSTGTIKIEEVANQLQEVGEIARQKVQFSTEKQVDISVTEWPQNEPEVERNQSGQDQVERKTEEEREKAIQRAKNNTWYMKAKKASNATDKYNLFINAVNNRELSGIIDETTDLDENLWNLTAFRQSKGDIYNEFVQLAANKYGRFGEQSALRDSIYENLLKGKAAIEVEGFQWDANATGVRLNEVPYDILINYFYNREPGKWNTLLEAATIHSGKPRVFKEYRENKVKEWASAEGLEPDKDYSKVPIFELIKSR